MTPSDRDDDEFDIPTSTGIFDQFQKARTSDDLSRPSVEPAIALTNEGWYEWRDGASEWTPLPSWWVRRLGSPHRHVPEGYIQRLNDTVYLPPGANLAATIDEIAGGRIVLERGEYHIGSQVRIPGNIVIEGQGPESVIQPETDTDMFLIGGDFPSGNGNGTALRNLVIDTTSVRDYTSTVATFTGEEVYHGGAEYLQNVVLHMPNEGKRGTGIALVDGSGEGIGTVTFGNVRIMFPEVAIYLEVNGGGFVNGNACRNVWAKEPRVGIQEVINDGVIRSNTWEFKLNGETTVERVLENRGDENHYDLFVDDLGRIDGPAITVEGDRNVLRNREGSPYLWQWVVDTGTGSEYEDRSHVERFLPRGRLPYWLDTVGSGDLEGKPQGARLRCGRSRGDEVAVTAPEGLFTLLQSPWLAATFRLVDARETGLTRLGFAGANSDDLGAYVVADPDDALGTGVTGEFLAQFGDGDGATFEPTGVSLDRKHHSMALRTVRSDGRGKRDLVWVLDGTGVRYERKVENATVSPWLGVRHTGDGRPAVDLSDTIELRFAVYR